jgi:hypothetical protein
MAKLVDALVSGTSVSNDVQVRVLFWAQQRVPRHKGKAVIKYLFFKMTNKSGIKAVMPLSRNAFTPFSAQMVKLVDTPA